METNSTQRDKAIAKLFLAIRSGRDLASFFGMSYEKFHFIVNVIPVEKRYTKFNITKRSGKIREICAPISAIKKIQGDLNKALYLFYKPRVGVHGYVKGNSIKTNAHIHSAQKNILNIDLKDFFPSIHLGRVYGIFTSATYPFKFNRQVAGFLANICCHENFLPQGAPTSPVISNFICAKLDAQLLRLAIDNKCYYSRYADDITFSTSEEIFSKNILTFDEKGKPALSQHLINIITTNDFEINYNKVRVRNQFQRHEVTGVVVNSFPNVKREYIRNLRALLHACEEYGVAAAEKYFFEKYDTKHRASKSNKPKFENIVSGRLHYMYYIRKHGDTRKDVVLDHLHTSLWKKFKVAFDKDRAIPIYVEPDNLKNSLNPLIITEAKTDWMHLKNAWRWLKSKGKFKDLELDFWEYDGKIDMSDSQLKAFCFKQSTIKKNKPYICIFDRDSTAIINQMSGDSQLGYKYFGESTFSFCIPKPTFRDKYENISIEFYYTDDEIHTVNPETGKQLLFTNDVDVFTVENATTKAKVRKAVKLKVPKLEDEFKKKIYSEDTSQIVEEGTEKKIAHSKTFFANCILDQKKGFDNFNLNEFEKIFQIIEKIMQDKSHVVKG